MKFARFIPQPPDLDCDEMAGSGSSYEQPGNRRESIILSGCAVLFFGLLFGGFWLLTRLFG
jgi:hypothetical protein